MGIRERNTAEQPCSRRAGSRRSAVVFDLDGTLTKPSLDFDAIRREIGVEGPILEALQAMMPRERTRAERILHRHEREAAHNAQLQDGADEVIDQVRASGRPVAILTRNSRPTVQSVLQAHGMTVDAIRTREDGAVKPSAEPLLSICAELRVDPSHSWMVGDFLFDIVSGRSAGTHTVLMLGDKPIPVFADRADHVIRSLRELPALLGPI